MVTTEKPDLNELVHFGVPGMKWGKRKAGLKAWGKEAGKMTKNNLRHPIITGKANKESIRSEKTFGAKARRSAAYQNTKDLKDVNARIDKMVANKKPLTSKQKKIIAGTVVAASAVTIAVVMAKTGKFKMPNTLMGKARNTMMRDIQGLHKDFMSEAQSMNNLRDQLRNLR
jgi:hypothetical protein